MKTLYLLTGQQLEREFNDGLVNYEMRSDSFYNLNIWTNKFSNQYSNIDEKLIFLADNNESILIIETNINMIIKIITKMFAIKIKTYGICRFEIDMASTSI